MSYTTISEILIRREDDIVPTSVDIVTFTAGYAIWYHFHANAAIAFTYFTINCQLYLNIYIVFNVIMSKCKILFCLSSLKN